MNHRGKRGDGHHGEHGPSCDGGAKRKGRQWGKQHVEGNRIPCLSPHVERAGRPDIPCRTVNILEVACPSGSPLRNVRQEREHKGGNKKLAHQPGTFESAPAAFLTRHHALRDASPIRDPDRQLDPHYRLQRRTCQPRPALVRVWERIWSVPCRRVSKPDFRCGLPLAAALPKGLDAEPFWPLPRQRCRMSGSQVAGHRKD